jgi:glyoxylase-like metal-dependent hydrolase (beta-lactamase superfamily II)
MHRTALHSALAALLAMSLAAHAQAPARPQVATTKVEGTDNVYIFRNGNHQSMFVVTNDGVIATDPIGYGRPTGGQTYLDEIRKVTDKPVKYVIYSHHHFDHAPAARRSRMPARHSSRMRKRSSSWLCSKIRTPFCPMKP